MKLFKITYYSSGEDSKLFNTELKAKTEDVAKYTIRSAGYEIKEILELNYEMNVVEKILDYYDKNFSTYTYSAENEISFLRAFAVALKDWKTDKEALISSKSSFSKSNKVVRHIIDKMISSYEDWNISHITDIFEVNEEFFSKEFRILMQEAKHMEVKIEKIISNPVSEHERWKKMEGYIEIKQSKEKLKRALINNIIPPLIKNLTVIFAALWVAAWLVPMLVTAYSKVKNVTNIDFGFAGGFTYLVANVARNYWIYFLLIVFWIIWIIIFLYNTNTNIKEKMQHIILKTKLPIIRNFSEILSVFYTKDIASMLAVSLESWMRVRLALESMSKITPFIPIQKELQNIAKDIASEDFEIIFNRYGQEEKYFTDMFYVQLESVGSEWKYNKALAAIVQNTDNLWEIDLSKYPVKIGNYIFYWWLAFSAFLVLWIWQIYVKLAFGA